MFPAASAMLAGGGGVFTPLEPSRRPKPIKTAPLSFSTAEAVGWLAAGELNVRNGFGFAEIFDKARFQLTKFAVKRSVGSATNLK
jgi:hypothetical protein